MNVKQHIHAHKILYYTIKTMGSYYSVQVFNKSFVSVETDIGKKTILNISQDQFKEFQKSLTKKTKWMTKDGKDTRVKRGNLNEYILNGWEFGRSASTVKGYAMCYDNKLNKHVRITKEEMCSNQDRYSRTPRIHAWHKTNQPNFPYVDVTAVTKEHIDSGEYETTKNLVALSDGKYIHESYYDSSIHEKKNDYPKGGRSLGLYITPYGNFQNCHEAKANIPDISKDTIMRWCKENKKPLIAKSMKNDFSFNEIPKETLIGMTPKELGFDFIPKEQCIKLSDGTLKPRGD